MPQPLPQQPGKPGGVPPKPAVPPPKPDTSLFRGQRYFKTDLFRTAPRVIPGYSQIDSTIDMKNLANRLRKDYGEFITKEKVPFILQKEQRRISETPNPAERIRRLRDFKRTEQMLKGIK